jgi:NitT/TauT family transport system substrate-binding protein
MDAFMTRRNLLAAALAATVAPGRALAQTPTVVRLGLVPSFAAGQAFYAADLGMFRRHGLDVQFQFMNNGASIASAIAGGSLDIGFSDVISISSAHLRGLDFVFIAPGFFNTRRAPGYAIVVRGDSPIRSARDFSGKTVAINAVQTISQLIVQAWVDGNGGDSRAVKFIELPFAQMVPSVQQKTVDACTPGEPFVTGAIDQGMRAFVLDRNGLINYMPAGYFATRGWIGANAETVQRVSAAIRNASLFANRRPIPAEAASTLSKYTKVPLDVVKGLRLQPEYGVGLEPAHVQPVIDAAAKYGILLHTFPAAEILKG